MRNKFPEECQFDVLQLERKLRHQKLNPIRSCIQKIIDLFLGAIEHKPDHWTSSEERAHIFLLKIQLRTKLN